MYLARIEVENFRLFGSREEGRHCEVLLDPGLNLVVGENDSGKTCLIDAIRLLTGTATAEYFTVTEDDFHVQGGTRASHLKILGEFRGLNTAEAGALLEYLSIGEVDGTPDVFLRMWLAARLNERAGVSARRPRVDTEFRAGSDDEGKRVESHVRRLLHATYMKPLRDAIAELAAKKGSRLAQILQAYPQIEGQERSDWQPDDPNSRPATLVGIMRRAEHDLRENAILGNAERDLNEKYLVPFSLGQDPLQGRISVRAQELREVLERLELSLADAVSNTTRGLGIHNVLFMATELLALTRGDEPELPLVLIEEPEAHLHPQRQLRVVEYLRDAAKREPTSPATYLQVVMTTHSPNLASKIGLKSLILMHEGQTYPMGPAYTKLEESDYQFLERFLDVTKSNLFFARGVVIVEGDAEAILLPTLAEQISRPFSQFGVSIVNVGHVGLFRYSRIFQRRRGGGIGVRVACVTDRDIPPTEAKGYLRGKSKAADQWTPAEIVKRVNKRKRNDGSPVRTFVSDCWTLEYDLALSGLATYVEAAIALAIDAKKNDCIPGAAERCARLRECTRARKKREGDGESAAQIAAEIYRPLYEKKASKTVTAQCLADLLAQEPPFNLRGRLPPYLVQAIDFVTGAADAGTPHRTAPKMEANGSA